MRISKIPLPKDSLIEKSFPVLDYSDCFSKQFHSNQKISLYDCIKFSLFNWPKWVQLLLIIRNYLVLPFGLKTDKEKYHKQTSELEITLSKGSRISFFDVIDCNNNEVLLGVSDKHLDACASIILRSHNNAHEICLATTVKYNNTLGKVYFCLIKPFHLIIMRTSLHRMINHYTKNK